MTVSEWIDENLNKYPYKTIRMMNIQTNKGYGCHWIVFKDCEIDHVKITSQWIFIYI